MYISDYSAQLMHQDRLREAERARRFDVLRDATEQAPIVVETGLLYQLKQWFNSRNRRQEVRDVRRATAV
ncbi:MAG: hypothetical protein IT319_01990 [Anaerolineae bacterium]|nr:hypothetical protein [Anaerolineae bacterium]